MTYFVYGYLPPTEIDALLKFYESLRGDYWSECNWNFTKLNNTNSTYFIPTHEFSECGLFLINDTMSDNLQTVELINFNFSNNLNGTLSDSISAFKNLSSFKIGYNPLVNGQIPSTICTLTKLQSVIFKLLSISGSVPVCMEKLLSLKVFSIEQCLGIHGNFPRWICDLHQLEVFELDTVNLNGTIPDCIGNLSQLTWFVLDGISNLSGSIPDSISNLSKLTFLEFVLLPRITGTINDMVFINNPKLETFYFYSNPLMNISIPITLCNASRLIRIGIADINVNDSYIPNCIGYLSDLQQLQISGWSLVGEIPATICNLPNLWHLEITLTSISGSIPQCISTVTNLKFIDFHSNQLHGVVPAIHATNLTLLDLHNNSLHGSLSNIFQLDYYSKLEIIALHDNNFDDADVTTTLRKLFKYSTRLKALSLYKNTYIHGYLPDFKNENNGNGVSLDLFQAFAAHKLDIYGTLPSHLFFGKNVSNITESALILHDNRLSSSIPPHLEEQQSLNNFSVVLVLGNLFYINSNDIPEWLATASLFVSATNLFVSLYNIMKSYITAIFSIIITLFVIMHHIFQKYIKKQNCSDYCEIVFVQDIDAIFNKLSDSKLLILIVCLLILYPFCNNYYTAPPFLTYFCGYFFNVENNNINIILLLSVVIFNLVMALILFKFLYKHNITDASVQANNIPFDAFDLGNNDNDQVLHIELDQEHKQRIHLKYCLLWMKLLFYFIMYAFGVSLTVIYILAQSLPQDNVFNFNLTTQKLITGSISLVLAFVNAIITPKFILAMNNIFTCTLYHRTKIILLLRTLTVIVIPIIFTMYYSNECGSNWNSFWNPCKHDKQQFDIGIHVKTDSFWVTYNCSQQANCNIHYKGFGFDFQVLSPSDVCESNAINDINFDKCFRHYFYDWTQVILNKMIIMIFMPFLIIFYKTVPQKMKNWYYHKNEKISINIDSEYTMIVSKMETILAFSIFCPLLIPVTIMAIFVCKYFYKFTVKKLKWKLTFSNYSNIDQYPFAFLWFGFIFQQIAIVLFFIYSIHLLSLTVILIVLLIIIDICLLVYLYWYKKKQNVSSTALVLH